MAIRGRVRWLWRAVDQHGAVLEILQRRRDENAACRLLVALLRRQGWRPRRIVTDKLASYAAAKREVAPTLEHRAHAAQGGVAHRPRRRAELQARPGGLRLWPEPRVREANAMVDTGSGVVLEVQAAPERFADEPIAARRMVERLRERHGAAPAVLTADKAYGSGPFLAWPEEEHGIEAHVPLIDRRHQTRGVLTQDAFRCDEASDTYTCPQGAVLRRYGSEEDVQRYRASQRDCGACPIKASCTNGKMRAPHAARPTRRSASGSGPARAPRPSAAPCGFARPSSTSSPTSSTTTGCAVSGCGAYEARTSSSSSRRRRETSGAWLGGRPSRCGTPQCRRRQPARRALAGAARAEPTRQQPTAMASPTAPLPRLLQQPPKYFGHRRGITRVTTWSRTNRPASAAPPCRAPCATARVALGLLLEQETPLRPQEIMTDTAAYSDVVFGLFWLLGTRFSPRLADIGGARLWRVDRAADCRAEGAPLPGDGALDAASQGRITTSRILAAWPDPLRLAGSLKLGRVKADGVMRLLQVKEWPTAQAARPRGARPGHQVRPRARVPRRRRQAPAHPDAAGPPGAPPPPRPPGLPWHRGELGAGYREGQEDALGALDLVLNAIALWNATTMQAVVERLQAERHPVDPADLARVSPLAHRHINLLDSSAFTVPEAVANGELRPLRNPASE